MKRTFLIIFAVLLCGTIMAQPAKRRTTTTATAQPGKTAATTTSATAAVPDRASLMFPTKDEMPEDVSWRRDIFRQLDLKRNKNAALYYPVEPDGQQMNLFTCLFRLMLTGRVNVYNYKMDGNPSFAEKDRITDLVEFLKDMSIYYEEKNGRPTVADADIPSREVVRYYLKESSYLDQRTGTTHTKVVALCPVMLEGFSDEFAISSDYEDDEDVTGGSSAEANYTSKPLFWVRYDDVAPFLSKLPVMSSDLNNVTNMTAADYFNMNRYEGKIYKTNNMQGQLLKDYCKTDSAMVKEQDRIEKELKDFEEHLWGHVEAKPEAQDSIVVVEDAKGKKAKVVKTTTKVTKSEPAENRRSSSAKTEKSSSSASAPRVSARRERR